MATGLFIAGLNSDLFAPTTRQSRRPDRKRRVGAKERYRTNFVVLMEFL